MTSRIDEIIAKSKLEALSGFSQYEIDAIYNLAELIVKKCASIARNADLEDVEGGDSDVLRAASDQIEKYFGV